MKKNNSFPVLALVRLLLNKIKIKMMFEIKIMSPVKNLNYLNR